MPLTNPRYVRLTDSGNAVAVTTGGAVALYPCYEPCNPVVEVTCTWTDGDPTKTLFDYTWTNGETKLLCPDRYARVVTSTVYYGSLIRHTSYESWVFGAFNGSLFLRASQQFTTTSAGGATTGTPRWYRTVRARPWYFTTAGTGTTKGKLTETLGGEVTQALSTNNINRTAWTTSTALIADNQFGQLTTTDGVTVQWQRNTGVAWGT